jgi:streptogramin lyase
MPAPRPQSSDLRRLTSCALIVLLVIVATTALGACDLPGTASKTTGPVHLPTRTTKSGAATVVEYLVPTADGFPSCLAFGPDGAIWITEQLPADDLTHHPSLGRFTRDGVYTKFTLPQEGARANPEAITLGPDGALWFTQPLVDTIGRISPTDGVVQTFATPTPTSQPHGITAGPDGNLWFVEGAGDRVGRITPAGVVSEFALPTPNDLLISITPGPTTSGSSGPSGSSGDLWFTAYSADAIGRITTAGVISLYPLSDPDSQPWAITAGADGNLWFTEPRRDRLGRITPAGVVSEVAVGAGSGPEGVTLGADGALWYAAHLGNAIGRFTPATGMNAGTPTTGGTVGGKDEEFALPTLRSGPNCLTKGPDGAMWFTESFGAIGSISPPASS